MILSPYPPGGLGSLVIMLEGWVVGLEGKEVHEGQEVRAREDALGEEMEGRKTQTCADRERIWWSRVEYRSEENELEGKAVMERWRMDEGCGVG